MLLAVGSRAMIEQAKGIVMEETSSSADVALEVLVIASQQQNRSVRDVAQTVVERIARV
jgi:AmiR/NasT family two-component response regulator